MLRVLFLLLLLPITLSAEDKPAGACASKEHRQFDFWIGDWEVFDTKTGDKVGNNRIEAILADCALQESWTGAKTSRGRSLNSYDRITGQWHQAWVDNSGLLLRLDGGLDDKGRMVLQGPGVNAEGKPITHRITWTPQIDTVRQQWDMSEDSGKSWAPLFDGTYRRKQ